MDDNTPYDPTKRKPLEDNLGMGPLAIPPPMMNGAIGVPPISRPLYATPAVPSSPTSPSAPTADKTPMGAPMSKQGPHEQELDRLNETGSGVSQVQQKHPFWGGVLRGLDVAGSIINPGITAMIPGTTLHHNALVNREEGLANQDVARQEKQAQAEYTQQRPQMEQAVMEHQDEMEAQKEQARAEQQRQAQKEAQDRLDQTLGQQQDRADQQQEVAEQRAKDAEANMNAHFAQQEKLANIREAGMEHRANAARIATQDKAAQKQTMQLQAVIDDAQQAHVLKDMGDKGNAPADVDLALQFFKTMKGAGSSGIRFTQQEQKLILGARNSGQGLVAIAQKVVGQGQPLTPEQRQKMVDVIDTHAHAAQQAIDRLNGGGGEAPAAGGGLKITRDANGRIIGVE